MASSTPPPPRSISLSVKQGRYVFDNEAAELVYSGAFRAGKSVALCLKTVLRADRPGGREFLARKTLKSLKATTLVTLLQGDNTCPPLLMPGTYDHHKTEQRIRLLATGGEIHYFGVDDLIKLGSRTFTGGGGDELSEWTYEMWQWLQYRCNASAVGIRPQIYGCTNPDGPSHWIAQRFGLAPGAEATEGARAIQTTSWDNAANLHGQYLEMLRRATGTFRKRYVEGLWVASDHMVYADWDRTRHVQERAGLRWASARVCVDDGNTMPFAAYLLLVDSDSRVHVAAEVYAPGLTERPKVEHVKRLIAMARSEFKVQVSRVLVDPAAAVKLALVREGFPVANARNEIEAGIQEVARRLLDGPDGAPLITVEPACKHMIAEFETYARDPKTDLPLDDSNHAMDALRYGIMDIFTPTPIVFDMGAMRDARKAAEMVVSTTGEIMHDLDGRARGVSLARQERDRVNFSQPRRGVGSLRLLGGIAPRPDLKRRYAIFAAVSGHPERPGYAVVGDTDDWRIVAEQTLDASESPTQTAERLAMLSLWFGGPALVGIWGSPAGRGVANELGAYAWPVWSPEKGETVWAPDDADLAEAMSALRVALEQKRLREIEPAAFQEANLWGWKGKAVRPLMALDDAPLWAGWADRPLARCGLWQMLLAMGQRPAPTSHRDRLGLPEGMARGKRTVGERAR